MLIFVISPLLPNAKFVFVFTSLIVVPPPVMLDILNLPPPALIALCKLTTPAFIAQTSSPLGAAMLVCVDKAC